MKQSLRNEMLKKRKELAEEERKFLSERVMQKLLGLPEFRKAKKIGFYLAKDDEVQTLAMIKHCWVEGKEVLVPVVEGEGMKFVKYSPVHQTKNGSYNIPEPEKKEYATGKDLVVVPGVVFDRKGNRIGRGRAYYDKYLKGKRKVLKVGVAFSFQVVDSLPKEGHDVPVDIIVTEKEVIRCRK